MQDDVMCHRVGAPPLRFRGALLSHAEVQGTGAERLFLSLWARETKRRRDLVVAFSERRCDWRAHALVAANLDAAIGVVESRCDTMRMAERRGAELPETADRDALILALEDRCRDALDVQRFRQLAAIALDEWFALLERGDAMTETATTKGT
jgi:hypothetical protein